MDELIEYMSRLTKGKLSPIISSAVSKKEGEDKNKWKKKQAEKVCMGDPSIVSHIPWMYDLG